MRVNNAKVTETFTVSPDFSNFHIQLILDPKMLQHIETTIRMGL